IDSGFRSLARVYGAALRMLVRRPLLVVAALAGLIALGIVTFRSVPSEFTPQADVGRAFVSIEGPEGSSFDYIDGYARQLEQMALDMMGDGEVQRILLRVPGGGGNDVRTGDVNSARVFLILKPWEEREHTARQIVLQLVEKARSLPGVRVTMGTP